MGFLDQPKLQVNYRNPVYLPDQNGVGHIFYIKEQQMDVEWLIQEAWNWSLVSRIKSSRIMDDWIPTKSTVEFTNVSDPSRFTATYTLTWTDPLTMAPPSDAQLLAAYASVGRPLLQGLFFKSLLQLSIAALFAGIPNWAEEVWTFQWTPGLGDGQAASLASLERETQKYVDFLFEQGLIK